uniref:Uncharacterized protein n=1 Tax=Setaria viridis TaxID=4556 RepID=A0A4V6D207_SETVI|nr:hypothetical protein SEVIR_9G456650v2 [Setaria viridis]
MTGVANPFLQRGRRDLSDERRRERLQEEDDPSVAGASELIRPPLGPRGHVRGRNGRRVSIRLYLLATLARPIRKLS